MESWLTNCRVLMEANLMQKFLKYMKRQERGVVDENKHINDSGITFEDMRSNDVWSLSFLLLLTYSPKFAYCYHYGHENAGGEDITFNQALFKTLFAKVLRKYKEDENFCYVLSRMVGWSRFESVGDVTLERQSKRELYSANRLSVRDLKFFVWLLTYKGHPRPKIAQYEGGQALYEVDECEILGLNRSLYEDTGIDHSRKSKKPEKKEVRKKVKKEVIVEQPAPPIKVDFYISMIMIIDINVIIILIVY